MFSFQYILLFFFTRHPSVINHSSQFCSEMEGSVLHLSYKALHDTYQVVKLLLCNVQIFTWVYLTLHSSLAKLGLFASLVVM